MKILGLLLSLALASPAFAQKDPAAYCASIVDSAEAQKTLYRMPFTEIGVSQPTVNTPASTYAGFTGSLSAFRKSQLVMPAAKDGCDLYQATLAAQENIMYAIPNIERSVLSNRLVLERQAESQLDVLIVTAQRRVDAQDATLPDLYMLKSAKAKMQADSAATELQLAVFSNMPDIGPNLLSNTIRRKQDLEVKTQQDAAKLARADNWDVTLMVGARQNTVPFFDNKPAAYGGFDARWNIGSFKRDKELDKAAADYGNWKLQQESDVVRESGRLTVEIQSIIEAQQTSLATMQETDTQIQIMLDKISPSDTDAAATFRNQLTADQLALRVEIGTTQFRLARLKQYLTDNF